MLSKKILYYIILFFIGGYSYCLIEILIRGFSHISMFIAGGICFVFIGIMNYKYANRVSLVKRMIISTVFITLIEFLTGLIVNIWLRLNVWDYTDLPFNFMGQISLIFCVIWFGLSFVAIIMDNYIIEWLRKINAHKIIRHDVNKNEN